MNGLCCFTSNRKAGKPSKTPLARVVPANPSSSSSLVNGLNSGPLECIIFDEKTKVRRFESPDHTTKNRLTLNADDNKSTGVIKI